MEVFDTDSDTISELGTENSFKFLGIDRLKQNQSREAYNGKLQQWLWTEPAQKQDELQGARPYFRSMAQKIAELSNLEYLLALMVEGRSYRKIGPPSA